MRRISYDSLVVLDDGGELLTRVETEVIFAASVTEDVYVFCGVGNLVEVEQDAKGSHLRDEEVTENFQVGLGLGRSCLRIWFGWHF